MPSQPRDTGWDFGSVIHLIDSDVQDMHSPRLRPKDERHLVSVIPNGGIHLGSFGKLYEDLGLSNVSRAEISLDPESELSNNSDDALLSSPMLDAVEGGSTPSSPLEGLEQLNKEVSKIIKLSKKQRKKARERAEKERSEEPVADKAAQSEAEVPVETPSKAPRHCLRSSVGAKVRPASPVPTSDAPALKLQEPVTPKPLRPILKKQFSSAQPVTPRVAKPVKCVPITPTTEVVQAPQVPSPTLSHMPPMVLNMPGILHTPQFFTPIGQHGLVPRTVRPVTVPRSSHQPPTPVPQMLPPPTPKPQATNITIRSQVDRHFHFFNQLLHYFPDDRRWLLSPRQLVNENAISHGLHVFVDASNIMYGLRDALRSYGVYHPYEISFDSLALLMERRRPVAKRVFAGSHREANPLPQVTKILEDSRAVGYESNVKEQVFIVREDSEKKRFFNDVKKVGWLKAQQMRSGSGSDSETGLPTSKTLAAPKWVEQGVDEILHLKMCQSIIDTEVPSVMVVATGDGAEAEMSDGFLAHVERALRKGWKVELISWRQQLNGGYRNRKFRTKWADQFSIIELDDFVEDLIDTP